MEEYARVLGSLHPDYEISIIDNPINMCWVVRVRTRPSLGGSVWHCAEDVVSHYRRAMMAEADFVLHLRNMVERAIRNLESVHQPAQRYSADGPPIIWGDWSRCFDDYISSKMADALTGHGKPKYSQAELEAWDAYDMEDE